MNIVGFFSLGLSLTAAIPAAPVEPADSTATDLQEITVQGRTQRTVKNGVEYTPDQRTKRAAQDAASLLMLMQLPQLKITPGSSDIKKLDGSDVSVFINFHPASEADLKEMRTADVIKVEVLEYPADPRFNGAASVVNFIMHEYEWGGYSSLTLGGTAMSQECGEARLYSKFAYKRMTYDVNTGAALSHTNRYGSTVTETFRDIDFLGRHYDRVDRVASTGLNSLTLSNGEWASLRAVYSAGKTYLTQTAYFSRNASPVSRNSGTVTFDPAVASSPAQYTSETSFSNTAGYNAYFQQGVFARDLITATANLSWTTTHRNSLNRLEGFPDIVNNNREQTLNGSGTLGYSHFFSHGNQLRATLITYNSHYRTRYMGSYEDLQRLLSSENMLFIEYLQNFGGKLDLYSRAGVSYVLGRVNDKTTLQQWNPRLGFQLQYRPNDNHFASWEAWWGNAHPFASSSNSATVQSSELLWIKGNPDLRNTIFAMTAVKYNYIPSDWFSLTGRLEYEGNYKRLAYIYSSEPGYDGLVRHFVNSGDAHGYTAQIGANVKLLDKRLSLSADGNFTREVLTGAGSDRRNLLNGSLTGIYYLGNFSLALYYSSPTRQLNAWTYGTYYKYSSSYGLQATYGIADLNVTLNIGNWFRKTGTTRALFATSRYTNSSVSWSEGNGRYLSLSIKYTVGYGKKVKRGNEVGAGSGGGSAILK